MTWVEQMVASMHFLVYWLDTINHLECWNNREKFLSHEPKTSDLIQTQIQTLV